MLQECVYRSVWDGGYCIDTPAVVDTETGHITSTPVDGVDDDGEDVEILDAQYVMLGDNRFNITEDDNGVYRITDIVGFVSAVSLGNGFTA